MRLPTKADLENRLARIDGRGYGAYKDLRGDYDLGPFRLCVDHVQADPFAPPSRIRVVLELATSGFEAEAGAPAPRRLGLEDYLGRLLEGAARDAGTGGGRGGSRHGFRVDAHGQEMLVRTVVNLGSRHLEARMGLELPAAGRRVLGGKARRLLLDDLPRLVERCLLASAIDGNALRRHQDTAEDHAALTGRLVERGWVAFIANGSLLARRAGHDDRPLLAESGAKVVPFQTPEELNGEVTLPNAGAIRGMTIPRGVTLLVGGGFHGKSTLLSALARGIYPHVPGDGREQVAALPTTVTVRAEDGRAVTGADITPFIDALPFGASTKTFTTQNASGSTSQAANIVEALEAGAELLLIDEDSSATNFMIRDEPMRRLLRPGQEPITPFMERVRELHEERNVSTILVIGGSGEYFRVADRVVLMDHYRPHDVTAEARRVIAGVDGATGRPAPAGRGAAGLFRAAPRRLRVSGYGRDGRIRVKAVGTRRVVVEREEVALEACDQLVSAAQVRTLSETLARMLEGGRTDLPAVGRGFDIPGLLAGFAGLLEAEGLDGVTRFPRPDLASVRPMDLAGLINRLRRLESAQSTGGS